MSSQSYDLNTVKALWSSDIAAKLGSSIDKETQKQAFDKVKESKDTISFILDNKARIQQEDDLRNLKIMSENIQINIATNINGYLSDALYYAERNDKSQALEMISRAKSNAQSGIDEIAGLSYGDSSGGLDLLTGSFSKMESSIAAIQSQVIDIEPTDEELLRLTGIDSKGKDFRDHIQNKIAGLSLSTTPRRAFESLLALLYPGADSSSDMQQLIDEILKKKSSSSASGSGSLVSAFSSEGKSSASGFAGAGLTNPSSGKDGSIVLNA